VEQKRRVPFRETSTYTRSHAGALHSPSRSMAGLPSTIASPVAMGAAQLTGQDASALWKCRCHGSPSCRDSVGTAFTSRMIVFSSTHAASTSPRSTSSTTKRSRPAHAASSTASDAVGKSGVREGGTASRTAAVSASPSGAWNGRPCRSPGVTLLINFTAYPTTSLV
jgi:hypothetical protein